MHGPRSRHKLSAAGEMIIQPVKVVGERLAKTKRNGLMVSGFFFARSYIPPLYYIQEESTVNEPPYHVVESPTATTADSHLCWCIREEAGF